MARLLAFGGDSENAHKRLDEFDSVDLEAVSLARAWGVNSNEHKPRQWAFSPCPRPDCGGAIVDCWAPSCILCARDGQEPVQFVPGQRNGYRRE